MQRKEMAQKIIRSRGLMMEGLGGAPPGTNAREDMEEGGCGVIGFACNIPVKGRHIVIPSIQMHNRGNGKGGGIAAVGLSPEQLGVDGQVLSRDFILQVALLDEGVLPELEASHIRPVFHVDQEYIVDTLPDHREAGGLELCPPKVKRYFVRPREDALEAFARERGLMGIPAGRLEEEFVYQNSFSINYTYYSITGDKRAFVLSHGRDMVVFKIVGYAEQAAHYYRLLDMEAKVWIAHQRYPTKGKVWHPAGAHPFVGMDEALVHNGDFANYYSVAEYLRQRNIHPLFLTDTEVSVLMFDLLNRVYEYPLEYIIEALAPTGELDFDSLPKEKQRIYKYIQETHIHGSPDGPWFFIIARSLPRESTYQLIGITDTSMLRPQVFALQKGEVEIGLIASEKQAIDATLRSLALEDPRFGTFADRYWNARGGSATDGGAFVFHVSPNGPTGWRVTCTDKFGRVIEVPKGQSPRPSSIPTRPHLPPADDIRRMEQLLSDGDSMGLFEFIRDGIPACSWDTLMGVLEWLSHEGHGEPMTERALEVLTLLLDRRYPTGQKRRRSILQLVDQAIEGLMMRVPMLDGPADSRWVRLDFRYRDALRPPVGKEEVLVMDSAGFPPEGDDCDASWVCRAYKQGWRRFVVFRCRGQRFMGCGLGPDTHGVRIDAYGSTGDYLGSGMDGMELHVHGNGQDQLGQILKSGRLVVHGDVGQTFMYGAKGGEVYVLGNAAGRPLINAVGRPRVVINGTALDFLAESFMAGDPHNGGGFVVLNGITFNDQGQVVEQPTPYPGSNLFSLASGGALYVRDPHRKICPEQLNGGEIAPFTLRDWELILPYLEENERLFGIRIEEDLLRVNGDIRSPQEVYRTIRPVGLHVLK